MKIRGQHFLAAIMLMMAGCFIFEASAAKDVPMFLKTTQLPKKVYDGERVIYEVTLFTTNPNIVGIEIVEPPVFSNLPFMQTAGDSELSEVEIDGKPYFKMVIDRYFIGSNGKGIFPVGGGVYRVTDLHRTRVRTLFDGDVLVDKPVANDLAVAPASLKVFELPTKGKPEVFSGAVGDFSISLALPPENPVAGESCSLSVLISGKGDLSDAGLPDIMHSFPSALGFKSMTDSRSHYVKDGGLGSEIEIEVTFSPKKAGKFEIGKIGFQFFNPETAKYETFFSEPVEIEVVESSSSKSSDPPAQLDI